MSSSCWLADAYGYRGLLRTDRNALWLVRVGCFPLLGRHYVFLALAYLDCLMCLDQLARWSNEIKKLSTRCQQRSGHTSRASVNGGDQTHMFLPTRLPLHLNRCPSVPSPILQEKKAHCLPTNARIQLLLTHSSKKETTVNCRPYPDFYVPNPALDRRDVWECSKTRTNRHIRFIGLTQLLSGACIHYPKVTFVVTSSWQMAVLPGGLPRNGGARDVCLAPDAELDNKALSRDIQFLHVISCVVIFIHIESGKRQHDRRRMPK